ncbi:hypothetical protein [Peptostreptococcus faecalis]|uniref:hypothetical protein n=1 Tax=Peptostreptococcus faecalis TaxID=2045015 RepID=UPI000C7BB8AA|nr:hypothetical protein [Peptostreptococcus faecalis]
MLKNLMKYEIKSVLQTFIPIYAIMILSIFLVSLKIDNLSVIGAIALPFSIIAIFIAFLILTINRFKKSLLGDEGYLMFTIPASSFKIVMSKMTTMILFYIITIIIFVLSVSVMIYITLDDKSNIIKTLVSISSWVETYNLSLIPSILNTILATITELFAFIATIYLSLSIAQIGRLKKHSNLYAIIIFFAVQFIISYISVKTIGTYDMFPSEFNEKNIPEYINIFNVELLKQSALQIIQGCTFIWGTIYILNNKLNLD